MAARKRTAAPAATPGAQGVQANVPTPEVPEVTSSHAVTVEFKGQTREFSKEVHGAGYKDLATQFAAKHGGTIQ